MIKASLFSAVLTVATFLLPGLYAYGTPTVSSIGGEQVCGSGQGRAPAIAVDSKNQPHVVADVQGQGRPISMILSARLGAVRPPPCRLDSSTTSR